MQTEIEAGHHASTTAASLYAEESCRTIVWGVAGKVQAHVYFPYKFTKSYQMLEHLQEVKTPRGMD